MGVFPYYRLIFLLACIDRWKVCNRLFSTCTVNIAIEVYCLCISTSKKRHSCWASSFPTGFFAIYRVDLAFRMTIIEDTHLTLAVIPFKVEANNSLTH